jgi:hypothetical protein
MRYNHGRCGLLLMAATIEPEPSDGEREAILAALDEASEPAVAEWAEAALLEGVESGELDP